VDEAQDVSISQLRFLAALALAAGMPFSLPVIWTENFPTAFFMEIAGR